MNLDEEVRDEPVEYGSKEQKKRKRRENLENHPPAGMIAKNLFGGPAVFTAKDPFSVK